MLTHIKVCTNFQNTFPQFRINFNGVSSSYLLDAQFCRWSLQLYSVCSCVRSEHVHISLYFHEIYKIIHTKLLGTSHAKYMAEKGTRNRNQSYSYPTYPYYEYTRMWWKPWHGSKTNGEYGEKKNYNRMTLKSVKFSCEFCVISLWPPHKKFYTL